MNLGFVDFTINGNKYTKRSKKEEVIKNSDKRI